MSHGGVLREGEGGAGSMGGCGSWDLGGAWDKKLRHVSFPAVERWKHGCRVVLMVPEETGEQKEGTQTQAQEAQGEDKVGPASRNGRRPGQRAVSR